MLFRSDKRILSSTFYAGLKSEIKMHLVGRHPDTLKELKSVAIHLDEERTTTQGSDHCKARPRPSNRALEVASSSRSEAATWQSTPEVKAETARIGAGLSKEERERRLKEGRCFGYGEKGHRRPECPNKMTTVQIGAVEPTDLASEANPTHGELGN